MKRYMHVSYSIDTAIGRDLALDKKIEEKADIYGFGRVAGGSGFGTRDLEFEASPNGMYVNEDIVHDGIASIDSRIVTCQVSRQITDEV